MKTEIQIIENLRDEVYTRIVTNKINKLYWEKKMKKAEVNTQKAVEAKEKININILNIKADKMFLKIIDNKIVKLNKKKI
jgi:hypothetical protein